MNVKKINSGKSRQNKDKKSYLDIQAARKNLKNLKDLLPNY
jgi:hypothetical protein